jgi:hypothetical protein
MGMQTDVLSYHTSSSGLIYGGRTRLKGVVLSPTVSVVYNSCFVDTAGSLTGTYNIPNSTVCTITIADHGLANGSRVAIDFTSGTAQDDAYTVANATANTFTVTTGTANTSGNATVYSNILMELDSASGTAFYTLIPGEGIVVKEGLAAVLPIANVSATVFYG